MSILKEIAVFQNWVRLSSYNTRFADDAVFQKYLSGLFYQHMRSVDVHKRQHLKVLVAMRLGAKISASDALLAGEHGLVHCLIFGPGADPFLLDVTPGAFEIISHSGCAHLSHIGASISGDFSQVTDLVMKMRSCSGTGVNDLIVL